MRKLMIWLLVALMALSGCALAETAAPAPTAAAVESDALNGRSAVRVGADLYLAIPDGTRQMLVRVPTNGGDPVCVDRGDRFEDLIPYAGGVAYLKTENNSSAIMSCNGMNVSTVYGFGSSSASCLSYYSGRLLVLIDGLLHSIEPGTQLCLRLSGSAMLDYVLSGSSAYFLSAGDRMEYTATLEDGQTVSTQAGCVYHLDLNTGETAWLLKSGGRDLQIANSTLYFHSMTKVYAVRSGTEAQLRGYLHSLDVVQRNLNSECDQPDTDFWALPQGLVVWYGGALNAKTEAGTLALYTPEAGATVVTDGDSLYVWESGKQTLTQVQLNGTLAIAYTGDLAKATDVSLLTATATPAASASASASATAESEDVDSDGDSNWFSAYMDNQNNSNSSSGGGSRAQATPIGTTPTPAPTPVALNNDLSSFWSPDGSSSNNSSSGGSSSGGSSSGSSSTTTTSSGKTYNVNFDYVTITGGSVNMRSGPGTRYSVIATLSKGTVVASTGKASKDSGNNTWYQIKRGSTKGWVSAGYARKSTNSDLSKSGPEWSKSGSTVTITGATVNVRSKPGLGGKDVGTVKKGDVFTFKGKASTDARGVDWYKISYSGSTAWVSSRYSKVTGSSATTSGNSGNSGSGSYSGGESTSGTLYTTGSVNIRKGPGKKYDSVGTIPKGTGLKVTKKAADAAGRKGVTWYYTSYKGKSGWVSNMNLSSKKSSGSSSSGGSSSNSSGSRTTTGSVNIRSKANRNSSSVGTVPKGVKLSYDKTAKDGEGRKGITWYHVTYKGKTGWISSMYFK